MERNSPEAGVKLRLISLAGKLELERTGDRFTADLADYYLRTSPTQRKLIRQGRRCLTSGSELYAKAEFEAAARLYRQGQAEFVRAGDTCETLVARSRVGACYLRIPYIDQALSIFNSLVSYSSRQPYKLLLAQSLMSVADAEASNREFSKGLDTATRARVIYEAAQDQSGVLWSLQASVTMNQEFGHFFASIGAAIQALNLAESLRPGPLELWPFYQQIASNLNAAAFPSMALRFEEPALRLAAEAGVPLLRSRSYALLALIHQKLNNHGEALRNGQLALTEARSIGSEKVRTNLIAHSTLNLAHVYKEMGAFDQALSLYNRSIDLHEQLRLPVYVAEAHKGS